MLDWIACTLVNIIGGVLCLLPPSVAVWIGERFGLLAYWLQPKRTRIGIQNLRAAFDGHYTPERLRRIIQSAYRQLGAGVVELLRLPVIDRAYVDRYITIEGQDHFEAALASERPVILLTGHYGNWELSSIVAALTGHPIVALARAQEKFPRLYRLLISYRESKGCKIVHKGGPMKRLIAALGARQLIGIVGDQASRQGIFVEFFGRPALFATGPFDLAYSKQAVILPAFIHRVHGAFHRIVIEPPITLSSHVTKSEGIRQGVERFAELLGRHITEDPGQWLWMHKRWKYTPARRVLILSDGKAGHVKQSLSVVEAMCGPDRVVTHQVVEIRYRHAICRGVTFLWSWWVPSGWGGARLLRSTLTHESASALLTRYADLIISCGASTVPANLLWACENRAKSIVLMNPAPIPLGRFALVIAPRHDALPRRGNVVETSGAVVAHKADPELRQAGHQLRQHPRHRPTSEQDRGGPVIALFVGGDTAHYAFDLLFIEALIAALKAVCEATQGWCLVTTSRRTSPTVEQRIVEQLETYPRCCLLIRASRDPLDGTMDGMLGLADVAVVTGESVSMVSEACASGRPVVVVKPPLGRHNGAVPMKHQRFLCDLVTEAYVHLVPVDELSAAIHHAITARQPRKRLETFAIVRAAVTRLL